MDADDHLDRPPERDDDDAQAGADAQLVQRFRLARRDPEATVLEGFHALKHGLRFGAELRDVVTTDPDALEALAARLAPDVAGALRAGARVVSPTVFGALAPHAPPTGVMAIGCRPAVDVAAVLADPAARLVVLLEDPRALGNVGACVRVAAAADAAAVLTTGDRDPWHPDAVRGAAGLHYALPVARVPVLPPSDRPLLALDPDGEPLDMRRLPPRAVLAFGTERDGLSAELRARADARVALPMRDGVSSLNLATAVAAVLFAGLLATGVQPGRDVR